jgi:hypothetical protein
MRLTAQMTTPTQNPVEYFGLTDAGILDEQDNAASADLEYEIEAIGLEEISWESPIEFMGH